MAIRAMHGVPHFARIFRSVPRRWAGPALEARIPPYSATNAPVPKFSAENG